MTEVAQPTKRGIFVSLRFKLIIAFTLLFTIVFGLAYLWFYTSSIDRAMARVTEDLDVILAGTAAKINGDDFAKLAETGKPDANGYTDDPLYWEQVRWLASVKELDPRAKLYTFIAGPGDHAITFVGSAGAVLNPPSGAQFLQVCTDDPDDCGDLTPNFEAIRQDRVVNQTVPYTDAFGDWISGYTPIHDSTGKVVGALGIDYAATYVNEVRTAIVNAVVPAFALTYAFLFITVWFIARTFSKPILSLTRIAERIGEGDYEQDFNTVTGARLLHDEIDTLAEVFKIMIGKVAQREEKLKQQVADLQIQIDHSKRDEQVKEIVDNDFFQSLQSKAFEMRSRRTQPPEQS
jgi:hypothetical protein